ncbi:heavy metal translocating P-type ATPase [Clostridium sp. Marseille-P299]|uniref:heavy metal translocating P-type ATPase n=1 Tax=Clostridium sp. Marseille-P299 TaxID=1805477 RepID=UPI00082C7374|nr:heavy metal translocating P-type ATPase [Clostridium sp. Marseille-P299]
MKFKKETLRIGTALIIFAFGFLFKSVELVSLALFTVAYALAGYDVLYRAIRNILRGQIFDENFLMAIATVGAFAIGDFAEGAAVMLFYQVGELFQSYAVNQSRKSITELMNIRPDFANVLREGEYVTVDPEEVLVGETILVKPGEKVPLDGTIIEGSTTLDTAALTGEALPREVKAGEEVISGCINLNGIILVQVNKEFEESTVAKILDLVENASSKKAKAENFITKFAKYYTPIVVIVAAILAIIPPILIPDASFKDWLYRALIFLVVSCPCALVISIPLGFFGGIGGASKQGILIKGSNYLEALANTRTVVFDKTGTLTKGNFAVTSINTSSGSEEELLELAAKAEYYSNHPISISIKKAYGKEITEDDIKDVNELPGYGVKAIINEKTVLAGNERLMKENKIDYVPCKEVGTIVYVAAEGAFLGSIVIADEIKSDAKVAILDLKKAGIRRTVMLTGDAKQVGEKVASELKIDDVYTNLLPGDKVEKLEKLLSAKNPKETLAYVGDGINDAPVLARADIGIAMGGLGSDAAIEAADIVIMEDEPSKIATAIGISRKTLRIVKQNIVFALGVKILVLILAAFGMSNMWEAVFADVGVSVIAILNAIRVLRYK